MLLTVLFSLAMNVAGFGGGEPGIDSSAPRTVNKTLLLQLVNDVRKAGCRCGDTWYPSAPALGWNDQLEQAAYSHAREMADKKYFSHDGKDGTDPGARIARAGYSWRTFAENIAMGYTNEQEAVAGWLNSPGHCRNLMNPKYTELGVARSGSYWTMNLASH